MKFFICARSLVRFSLLISLAVILTGFSAAQSSLQDHPTPITRNEISGTIKARDLGDARLTTHYYWFEGSQGDVFINLTSKNFAGDVDVFAQNGLKTLTKIIVYADFGEVETGRVIYLRKSERLLLRVQGRAPNDDPATYRLKFAGSFVAATGDESDVPEMPKVSETMTGSVRVNSVGTKLPPPPKPIETKIESGTEKAEVATSKTTDSANSEPVEKTTDAATSEPEKEAATKPEVIVTDPVKEVPSAKPAVAAGKPARRPRTTRSTPRKAAATPKEVTPVPAGDSSAEETSAATASTVPKEKPRPEPKSDPLASINLVILFKDGSKIERPLSEVFKFSVDRGVLTVISKNGTTGKYQMLDVAKVTIE